MSQETQIVFNKPGLGVVVAASRVVGPADQATHPLIPAICDGFVQASCRTILACPAY